MNLKERRELFIQLLKEKKLLFFIGSSISTDTGLPNPKETMGAIFHTFLSTLGKHRELLKKIEHRLQPEVFYESLLYIEQKKERLGLLQLYDDTFLAKHSLTIQPSLSHEFLVEYSFSSGLPLFTTNIDTLFELACIQKGYPYEIIIPSDKPIELLFKNSSTVRIIKLNGSISKNLDQLHLTLHNIYKTNKFVVQYLKQIDQDQRIAFIGYKGTDIDYFPHVQEIIKQLTPHHPHPYFWVTPSIQKQFPRRQDFKNKGVQSIPSAFTNKTLSIPEHPSKIFQEINPSLILNDLNPILSQQLHKLQKKIASDCSKSFPLSPFQTVLFLIILCQRTSEYVIGYKIGKELTASLKKATITDQVIYYYTMAAYLHNNGQFETYKLMIQKAQKITLNTPTLSCFNVRAKISLAEAKRINIPTIDIYKKGIKYTLEALLLKVLSAFIFVHFLRINAQIKKEKHLLFRKKHLSIIEVYTLNATIEHLIRQTSMLQNIFLLLAPFCFKKTRKYLEKRIEKTWYTIKEDSYQVGYMGGVGNCKKYLIELKGAQDRIQKETGEYLFNFMTDQIGHELIHMKTTLSQEKNGVYQNIKSSYLILYKNARRSGNHLNAIKALVGLIRYNQRTNRQPLLSKTHTQEFRELSQQIEGKYWQKRFQKILLILEGNT